VYTSAANQFRARARGGTWFYSNAAMTTGVYLAAGSNAWTPIGSDDAGDGLRPVDQRELLEKLASLLARDEAQQAEIEALKAEMQRRR
jgi:hypothetical protein